MASLDPKLSEVVLTLLQKFNRERGITVLVNIHVLELARRFSQRIIAFKKGSIAFDGPVNQLTESAIEEIYHMEDQLL